MTVLDVGGRLLGNSVCIVACTVGVEKYVMAPVLLSHGDVSWVLVERELFTSACVVFFCLG